MPIGIREGCEVPLNLEGKKAVVAEVREIATRSNAAIAAEYRGLTVAQMTQLRTEARNVGVQVRVVRNTLARRALEETEFACMSEHLIGPLVMAFSLDEPGAVARLVKEFARKNDKLVVRLVAFEGKLLADGGIDVLATLPTRDEALAQLLSVLQGPITKLVRTLAEPYAQLVRTLVAVGDQKQAA